MTESVMVLDGALADRDRWRPGDACPVARALTVVGTRSAILLIREAFYGTTRFDDFAARVEITEAVAAARLRELTEAGLLERHPYREEGQRTRYEYRLTGMGRELAPAVIGLYQWGAKYLPAPGSTPPLLSHAACGEPVAARVSCLAGHDVPLDEVVVRRPARPTRRSSGH